MKTTCIYAAPLNYDNELFMLNNIVKTTLTELTVEVIDVNLLDLNLPSYNGLLNETINTIIENIKVSDGVIFLCTVHFYAPCSIMQNFLDYLSNPSLKELLKNKNCMLGFVSKDIGEVTALEYVSKVINKLGGYDSVKMPLNSNTIKNMEINQEIKDIAEKQIEDFYRLIKQKRLFFIPNADEENKSKVEKLSTQVEITEDIVKNLAPNKKVTIDEIYQKYNSISFNNFQERDIDDITSSIAKKFKRDTEGLESVNLGDLYGDSTKQDLIKQELLNPSSNEVRGTSFNTIVEDNKKTIVSRPKSCKQLTASLPHKFLPQLAKGENIVFQIMVTGEENFNGSITIENVECFYEEGVIINPDITIISDSSVWATILKGEQSAQKAFMVGNLKVRGNILSLTKFDQLFKHSL